MGSIFVLDLSRKLLLRVLKLFVFAVCCILGPLSFAVAP